MKEKKIKKETLLEILIFYCSVIMALVFYFHPEILADSDGDFLLFSPLALAYFSGVLSMCAVILAFYLIRDVIRYMRFYEKKRDEKEITLEE